MEVLWKTARNVIPSLLIGFLLGCLFVGQLWFEEIRSIGKEQLKEATIRQDVLSGALSLLTKDKFHEAWLKQEAMKLIDPRRSSTRGDHAR